MLDNWTEETFRKWLDDRCFQLECGAFESFALVNGRVAITDNPELEKVLDNFVKAYMELNSWFRN